MKKIMLILALAAFGPCISSAVAQSHGPVPVDVVIMREVVRNHPEMASHFVAHNGAMYCTDATALELYKQFGGKVPDVLPRSLTTNQMSAGPQNEKGQTTTEPAERVKP